MEREEIEEAYKKGYIEGQKEGAARKEVEIVMRAWEAGLELGRLVLITGKPRSYIEKLIEQNEQE